MSQGYNLQIFCSGGAMQFNDARVSFSGDTLDTSSSLLEDGETPNAGFADRDGDLRTMTVEVGGILKDASARANLTFFHPQTRMTGVDYEIDYVDKTITGTGIFVESLEITGSIPGTARYRLVFTSLQSGYVIA